MPMNNLGAAAEHIALTFLQQKGLKCVTQNYSCRYGEIDLIMMDGKTLVFVEVRKRGNAKFGGAAESITFSKQQKLSRTAEYYLQQFGNADCRFDAILMTTENLQSVEWIQNAF